jgi:hypothetical protein
MDQINDIKEAECKDNIKFASLGICNMYTDIPNNELPDIIETRMENNEIDEHINKELMEWCKIILNQNYFQHHGEIYAQTDGLAVDFPTS